jgi:hypothetical protein
MVKFVLYCSRCVKLKKNCDVQWHDDDCSYHEFHRHPSHLQVKGNHTWDKIMMVNELKRYVGFPDLNNKKCKCEIKLCHPEDFYHCSKCGGLTN